VLEFGQQITVERPAVLLPGPLVGLGVELDIIFGQGPERVSEPGNLLFAGRILALGGCPEGVLGLVAGVGEGQRGIGAECSRLSLPWWRYSTTQVLRPDSAIRRPKPGAWESQYSTRPVVGGLRLSRSRTVRF
jgi:hypothetical protein